MFRGDFVDSVDGSAVERIAAALRDEEHGAPAADPVGVYRRVVGSVAGLSDRIG